jgi:hypothetical protein
MAVTLDWTTAAFSEKNGNNFEKLSKLYGSIKCKYLD